MQQIEQITSITISDSTYSFCVHFFFHVLETVFDYLARLLLCNHTGIC